MRRKLERDLRWKFQKIYLDFNASTPIASEVAEAMKPFLSQHFGNPSSQHWAGIPAKEAVEHARELVAEKMLVQGFHYGFPGLAHVEKTATGYREIPVLWNPMI